MQLLEVRAVAAGTPEWLRLAPTIVELFERREREQRLSDRASEAPRAVDWIYASEGGAILAPTTSRLRGAWPARPPMSITTPILRARCASRWPAFCTTTAGRLTSARDQE